MQLCALVTLNPCGTTGNENDFDLGGTDDMVGAGLYIHWRCLAGKTTGAASQPISMVSARN